LEGRHSWSTGNSSNWLKGLGDDRRTTISSAESQRDDFILQPTGGSRSVHARKAEVRTQVRRALAWALVVAPPLAMASCRTPSAPTPPGGGHQITLSFDQFQQSVEPVLVAKGCDAGGDCHGGGIRGTFALSAAGSKDAHFDFDQASLQVWAAMPDSSPLLLKPLALAAGGVPHSYKAFASTSDSGWIAIHDWIHAGVIH
jgi:hypothetical protein